LQGHLVLGPYQGQLSAAAKTWPFTIPPDAWSPQLLRGQPEPGQQSLRITEMMYSPRRWRQFTDPQSFEYIELKNIGAQNLSLAGVKFADGVTFDFHRDPSAAWLPAPPFWSSRTAPPSRPLRRRVQHRRRLQRIARQQGERVGCWTPPTRRFSISIITTVGIPSPTARLLLVIADENAEPDLWISRPTGGPAANWTQPGSPIPALPSSPHSRERSPDPHR